jgi:hypothetical protein
VSRLDPRLFSVVSALVPREAGRFDAELDPEWTIGGKPNGGYLLSILGRAATFTGSHEHVIAASAHYLRSPEAGPVAIETEVLRAGRSASQVRARMSQDGRACVEALVTASHLAEGTRPYWERRGPELSHVTMEDCARLVPRLADGLRVAILDQIEIRLEPGASGFTQGRPSGRGELRGWVILPGGEDFDPTSLLYAVDSFPPATFDIEYAGWVPTLELTAYVRALPAPGPIRVLQRAQLVEAERVDESCFVWDSTGRLVAQGMQLAGIRLA